MFLVKTQEIFLQLTDINLNDSQSEQYCDLLDLHLKSFVMKREKIRKL